MLLNSTPSCKYPVSPPRNSFLVILIMSGSYFVGRWEVYYALLIEGQKFFANNFLFSKLIILQQFEVLHLFLCIFDIGHLLKVFFLLHFYSIVKITTQNHLFSIIFLNHIFSYLHQDLVPSLIARLMWSQMTINHLEILSRKIKDNANRSFIPQNIALSCSKLRFFASNIRIDFILFYQNSSMDSNQLIRFHHFIVDGTLLQHVLPLSFVFANHGDTQRVLTFLSGHDKYVRSGITELLIDQRIDQSFEIINWRNISMQIPSTHSNFYFPMIVFCNERLVECR